MSRQFGVPVDHIRQQLPPMQLSHDLKLAYALSLIHIFHRSRAALR